MDNTKSIALNLKGDGEIAVYPVSFFVPNNKGTNKVIYIDSSKDRLLNEGYVVTSLLYRVDAGIIKRLKNYILSFFHPFYMFNMPVFGSETFRPIFLEGKLSLDDINIIHQHLIPTQAYLKDRLEDWLSTELTVEDILPEDYDSYDDNYRAEALSQAWTIVCNEFDLKSQFCDWREDQIKQGKHVEYYYSIVG